MLIAALFKVVLKGREMMEDAMRKDRGMSWTVTS